MAYHFTILGNPAVKKNSRNVVRNRRTGRMFPVKSKKLRAFEKDFHEQLCEQKKQYKTLPAKNQVAVAFHFYRKTKHRVDLSNLYGAAEDCLQAAGIIANDCLIESHDGSRKLYDPKNPRTEITITYFNE
jgi:Holliday junction resolvase RusA-like endonuclease